MVGKEPVTLVIGTPSAHEWMNPRALLNVGPLCAHILLCSFAMLCSFPLKAGGFLL